MKYMESIKTGEIDVGLKNMTTQELIELSQEILIGEWKLCGYTSTNFDLYYDLLDDDYILIETHKTPTGGIELDVSFSYGDVCYNEKKEFNNREELVSYLKKINNINLEDIKEEMQGAMDNYCSKLLK